MQVTWLLLVSSLEYYGDGGGEICIIKHNQISASNLGQADIQMVALLSTVELETNIRSLKFYNHGEGPYWLY